MEILHIYRMHRHQHIVMRILTFLLLRSGGAIIGMAFVGRLCGKIGRGGGCVCGA